MLASLSKNISTNTTNIHKMSIKKIIMTCADIRTEIFVHSLDYSKN